MSEEIVKQEKRVHHRLSPSGLSAKFKCIRFRFHDTESMKEAGDEGELLHNATRFRDMTGLDEYQKRDVQFAIQCADDIRTLIAGERHELTEAKLVLRDLTYGHCDLGILDVAGKRVIIGDYKFTRLDSDPGEQLRAYAAALVEMLASDEGVKFDDGVVIRNFRVETAETYVIAPRLSGGPDVQSYDAQELLKQVRADITELYARIDNPWLPPNPSHPELCARCAWAASCPAVNNTVEIVAQRLSLPLPRQFSVEADIAPSDRAILQGLAGALEKYSELVKQANTEYVKNGGEIPGFKLQSRSTGFTVSREMTLVAAERLKEIFGWDAETVMGAAKLSVPELADQMASLSGDTKDGLKAKIIAALQGIGVNGSCSFLAKVSKKDLKKLEGG